MIKKIKSFFNHLGIQSKPLPYLIHLDKKYFLLIYFFLVWLPGAFVALENGHLTAWILTPSVTILPFLCLAAVGYMLTYVKNTFEDVLGIDILNPSFNRSPDRNLLRIFNNSIDAYEQFQTQIIQSIKDVRAAIFFLLLFSLFFVLPDYAAIFFFPKNLVWFPDFAGGYNPLSTPLGYLFISYEGLVNALLYTCILLLVGMVIRSYSVLTTLSDYWDQLELPDSNIRTLDRNNIERIKIIARMAEEMRKIFRRYADDLETRGYRFLLAIIVAIILVSFLFLDQVSDREGLVAFFAFIFYFILLIAFLIAFYKINDNMRENISRFVRREIINQGETDRYLLEIQLAELEEELSIPEECEDSLTWDQADAIVRRKFREERMTAPFTFIIQDLVNIYYHLFLWQNRNPRQSDIARALNLSHSTTNRRLLRLAGKGLVERSNYNPIIPPDCQDLL